MNFVRRTFLEGLFKIPFACTLLFSNLNQLLASLPTESDPDELKNAHQIGTLNPQQKKILTEIFNSVCALWKMPPVEARIIEQFLNDKTQIAPSYFTEYLDTIYEYQKVTSDLRVWCLRIIKNPANPTELKIKKFVLSEFIRFGLSLGGFKSFGLSNYFGYKGGARGYRTYEG